MPDSTLQVSLVALAAAAAHQGEPQPPPLHALHGVARCLGALSLHSGEAADQQESAAALELCERQQLVPSLVWLAAQQPQGGRIVNNGSVSAASPRPGSVAYTATKHAVTGLTKSLSLDGRASSIAAGQIDYGNVVSAISAGMAVGMPQPDGSVRPEPRMDQRNAANAVHYMASLPLGANVLQMTVMATSMPFVGRG